MRLLSCILFLCGCTLPGTAGAYACLVSPDREFDAYTTVNHADGTGMKLFVRRHGCKEAGVLLAANDRWLDSKWSPDSRFLAIVNHSDGHISDVYVYGIGGSGASLIPGVVLYARNLASDTYDVKWDVTRWDVRRRDVLLIRDARSQPHIDRVRLHIGRHPLPASAWPILDGA